MTLLNTTFVYPISLEQEFRSWLKLEWIPACREAGLREILCADIPNDEDGTLSAAVQGRASSTEANDFRAGTGQILLEKLYEKYQGRILAFTTPMGIFEP